MLKSFIHSIGIFILSVVLVGGARAAGPANKFLRKIGEMELSLLGVSATVEPLNPVVPKNIPSGVRIVVQAGGADLSATDVARFLGGDFEVFGEISGPGLPAAVTIPERDPDDPPPADPLLLELPPLTVSGDYTLSNLRIEVGGKPVLDVTPRSITVQVIDQVLVTSVTTRPLTLDELKERGVVFDSDDYLGFEFTLGLLLESKPVEITFPVVFDRQGVVVPQPTQPPADPSRKGVAVPLPPLPAIIPLMLEESGGRPPEIKFPDGTSQPVSIPSVIVIPGNVGYLKQFFSAQLFVANGAPGGSGLVVKNIIGKIILPPGPDQVTGSDDDPLALPALVDGPQPDTLPVAGRGPDGEPGTGDDSERLNPGEQAEAEFLIRGEEEGFHTIDFNIMATLEGLSTGPVNLTGKASGGVLVRNGFFDMTFAVPSVVRKDEEFKLFVTVTNIGEGLANDLSVSLDASRMSGVELLSDPTDRVATLLAGDSTTLEFLFRSERTGQVVASYLKLDTGAPGAGRLKFTLAVGDRGVPLSPDTLVLPTSLDALSSSSTLASSVVNAAMRVLGQAWSVANAPAGTLSSEVIRISKTIVTEKALALAEAGLRVNLGQDPDTAVRDVAMDFYGGSPLDAGFDQLLRETHAGRDFARALGAALEEPMIRLGGLLRYEEDLGSVAVSGPDFMSFALAPTSGDSVDIALSDGAGRSTGLNRSPDELGVSEIPGAVFIPMGDLETAPLLGLLTQPTSSPYTLDLTGLAGDSVDIALTLPRGDGTFLRGATTLNVTSTTQARLVIDLFRPTALVFEVDEDGDGGYESQQNLTQQFVSSQGPRLISSTVIGPEILDGASSYGFHVAALFDRVVELVSASRENNYTIPHNSIQGVKPQLSGRLVFAALSQPEGPYVATTLTAKGISDLRGVLGPTGILPLGSRLVDPGAVVSGRVMLADGTPVGSGVVTYANSASSADCSSRNKLGYAEASLTSDGRYEFRYVRRDHCGGPFWMINRDPETNELREVSSYVRGGGEHITLDIVRFGRGSVAGLVTENGIPAPGADVVVVSGTDAQNGGKAVTDGDGRYAIHGILVGPLSVTAARGASLGRGAGNIGRAGTTAQVDISMDGGTVSAAGTVKRLEKGSLAPIPDALVVYSLNTPVGWKAFGVTTTEADGSYRLERLPPGSYRLEASLSAADKASITGVSASGDVIPGDLIIVIPEASEFGTVRGTVVLPDQSPAHDVIVAIGERGVFSQDGRFEIPGVTVKPFTSQTVQANTRDGLRIGRSSVIVNEPGQIVEGVIITLSGLGSARFTVLDGDGEPVRAQQVLLLGACQDPCGCIARTTGPDGVVTFDNLPLGTATAKVIFYGNGFVDVASATAAIDGDGETGSAILRLKGAGTVQGIVLDPDGDPAMGSDVTLTSQFFLPTECVLKPGGSHQGRTDENGRFVFKGVNLGRVGASATHPFFPDARSGVQDTLSSTEVPLELELRLVDTIAGVLSGTVFLPDGTTPAGKGVEVTLNGVLPDVVVKTDEQGRYEFAEILPQGSYTQTVRDPVTGGLAQEKIYLKAAEDVVHDVRLKGRGTVKVRVVDGADEPVDHAFVRLTETEFPGGVFEGAVEPSNQGVVTFENVFEGPFSIEAHDSFGRDGGRIASILPGPGETVEVKVRLTVTGTVKGNFRMPDGTSIAFGIVKLLSGGKVIGQATTEGSGEDVGLFSFDYVPAGPIRLEAQDPLTARTGVAVGTLETEGEVLWLDIFAQGLGTVRGVVTSNNLPQPSAQVEIVSGIYRATTFADSKGEYLVEGVPEGRVVVTASLDKGFLQGTASDTLIGDGNEISIDVALRASGEVTGQVLSAEDAGPGPPSAVTIRVGGAGGGTQTTMTDEEGEFLFHRVPAGLATVTVDVLGTIDQATLTFEVPSAGTVHVPVTLNGVGSITGSALDSQSQPTSGELTISGTGDFPYTIRLNLGEDGAFHLPEVLAGPITATLKAKEGEFTLYGTAAGTVAPGVDNPLVVQLEPSGTVEGLVFRSDGVTPALGAVVTLVLDQNRGKVGVQVQPEGTFRVLGVPFGGFTIRVADELTGGAAVLEGFQVNVVEPPVYVGEIVLDDSPIEVVAIDPLPGARAVDVNQPIRITFSDPVQSYGGSVKVSAGTASVPMSARLSPDGLTLTLEGSWPDSKEITVSVSTGVKDIFGRQPLQPFTSSFYTVDLSPPAVSSVTPFPGAIQVGVDTNIVVTFNEALDEGGTDLQSLVILTGPLGVVPGTTALTTPTTVTFTPDQPLEINTSYEVTVNGARDLSGNLQTAPFRSSFVTPDTFAPVLSLATPPMGGWTNTATPLIRVSMTDNLSGLEMATATLALDDLAVTPVVGIGFITYTPASPLSEGPHTVLATVADRAGNVGALSGPFYIDTTAPSAAELTGITDGQTVSGTLHIEGTATDEGSGVARIELLRDGFLLLNLLPPAFAADLNTTALSEGSHLVSVRAVDVAGNVGPESTPITVVVDNRPLTVTITSPPAGTRFRDEVTVTATVSEPATKLIFRVGSVEVEDSTAPYAATLDLSSVPEGEATLEVTGYGTHSEVAVATRKVFVDRTPPPRPNVHLINAEPPQGGFSLVHGRADAVESSAEVEATNTANQATAITAAGGDGSFALSLPAEVDDVLQLVARDEVGNESEPATVVVRRTPSLPPSEGTTSLKYEGIVPLVDRVGPGPAELAPDGNDDAIFTMSISIGEGITREISYIDLEGPVTRSTRPQPGSVLGVAADAGSPLLNNADGTIGFPMTSGTTLTLFAAAEGFIVEGETYTVTAAFTDGSRFVGTFTIVPAADRVLVAHSVRVQANPGTVQVPTSAPGFALLTLTEIRDIEGSLVPDGANVAVGVADMASKDPRGGDLRSAGGEIVDGEIAPNNNSFRIFSISGGEVTATYSSGTVTPAPRSGALAVVQVLAADRDGNVLGNKAIGTFDLNLRGSSDRAVITPTPPTVYADAASRLSHLTIEVRDELGIPVPDGTKVLVSAANCASRIGGYCVISDGGQIIGGEISPSGEQYRVLTVNGGVIEAEFSATSISAGPGNVKVSRVQVLPSDANGRWTSTEALGTAQVTLVGAASAEIDRSPGSVPLVYPPRPALVRVHHVKDSRGNLVPDGASFLLSATNCATRINGICVSSAGGIIEGGAPSPAGSGFKVFTLFQNELGASYSSEGVSANPGQTQTASVQMAMSDPAGNLLFTEAVSVEPVRVVAPTNAVGTADPTSLIADGGLHSSTVTFDPVLDAYGNPLPTGAKILASAANCAARLHGLCIASAGGQILNGEADSPSGAQYKIFTVEDGAVTVVYGDQGLTSVPGQVKEAKVVLLLAGPNGELLSSEAVGVVTVGLPGLTSAGAAANPTSIHADGEDRRSTVTFSNIQDALGVPAPAATKVAVTATNCASRINGICVSSYGGQIVGGEGSPSLADHYRVFEVDENGQIVVEYSVSGVSVDKGQKTATVQLVSISSGGVLISSEAVATVPILLLAPAEATIAANPMDLLADGGEHLSQIVVSDLLDTGGIPVPDGAKVGLSAANCAARDDGGGCIISVGGQILTAGVSPGDGEPATNNSLFRIFTVAGGEVHGAYSDENITAGVNETRIARVVVAPASGSGAILSTTAIGVGTIHLRGTTSATGSGPESLPLGSGLGTVTFTGIKDSAGNAVPDGALVVATAANCATRDQTGICVTSVGGAITNGGPSPSGAQYKVFTVTDGKVDVDYSTLGATVGIARIQMAPAKPDGTIIGNRSLLGGVWAITVTP